MHPRRRRTLSLITALVALGCRAAESTPEQGAAAASEDLAPEAAQVVEVVGLDYAFQSPEVIDPGWTTFRFANHGPEAHQLALVRLEGGHTVADLVAALRDHQPSEEIATPVGGANVPMPGAASNATVNLTPGEYALICMVPSPDGVPHVFKGMVKPITVREGSAAGAEPLPDLEITFSDYAFELSGQVTAGERTIRATTSPGATEPHEVVVARLAPGKTADDLNAWILSMQGPPPAEFIGGVTGLAPGLSNSFTIDFTPGDYVILCPLPSPDGTMHSMKGMVRQFTVS